MFEIYVDTVNGSGNRFLYNSEDMRVWSTQLIEIRDMISGMSGMEEIVDSLARLESEMKIESDNVLALYDAIRNITGTYNDAEDTIVDNITRISPYGLSATITSIGSFSRGYKDDRSKIDYSTLQELVSLIG